MKKLASLAVALACVVAAVTVALAQAAPMKWLSTASTNSTLVAAGVIKLTSLLPINTTTTVYYLKLYDKATAPTCGTDVPKWTVPLPYGASNAGGGVALPVPDGLQFNYGLGFCITGGIADNDSSNAAAGIAINMGVQVP